MKKATLGIIIKNNKIMLALKKRGFGAGLYNGVGGKLEKGEDSYKAMIREANEEIGIHIKNQEIVAKLAFYFPEEENNMLVDVFLIKDYEGNPTESDEMKPFWFDLENIPYDKMWDDDKIWLPEILKGGKDISYDFYFDNNSKIVKYYRRNFL